MMTILVEPGFGDYIYLFGFQLTKVERVSSFVLHKWTKNVKNVEHVMSLNINIKGMQEVCYQ